MLQICRYGKVCRTPNCQFIHPEVPANNALKWTAPKLSDSTVSGLGTSGTTAAAKPTSTTYSTSSTSSTLVKKSNPSAVLSNLTKQIDDLNDIVKKSEKSQVDPEVQLKEITT